jgi:hypothetical protein
MGFEGGISKNIWCVHLYSADTAAQGMGDRTPWLRGHECKMSGLMI